MVIKFIETKNKNFFGRRELLIGFCTALVVLISFVFPQKTFGETFLFSLLLFATFPVIIIYFLLKEPLGNFGLSWGKPHSGIIIASIITIIFILVNYSLVFHSKFSGELLIARGIADSFLNFLFFEIAIALPLHFFWEIFFRGFIQLGLEKKLGIYSLALAVILQTLLSLKGSWIAILLVFLSSVSAGLIIRQSRSVVYSAAALWLISVSLDIMLIRLINSGLI